MKKLLALTLAALCSSSLYALTWNFSTLSVDTPPIVFLDGSPSYIRSTTGATGTQFNLLSNGYNPATMLVTSATVTFWFADDDSDSEERVDIFVNGTSVTGTKIKDNLEVNGSHGGAGPYENFAAYSANLQDFAGLIAALQDGVMEWEVKLESGDTYLKIAEITANGQTKNVSDTGSSVALLGGALLVLGFLRRRLLR
jgi:hypothetical protein